MKRRIFCAVLTALTILFLTGCDSSGEPRTATYPQLEETGYQDCFYTPWPEGLTQTLAEEAGNPSAEKAYTLMIYMNGSDLESDGAGMASADLQEMLDSDFDPDQVNVVIYAGGTTDWDSSAVDWADEGTLPGGTSGNYTIVRDGGSNKLTTVNYDITASNGGTPLAMMDGGTLAGFIDYAAEQFPARHYALEFWNHGSGSLIGYGYDHLVADGDGRSSMGLITLKQALDGAGLNFDWVGFDTCLMSGIETALAVRDHADYLVASQELEPGDGWDYVWLKELSDNPQSSGEEVGISIVDSFNEYYRENVSDTGSTLSVTDLSKTDRIVNALGALSDAGTEDLGAGEFTQLANARDKTETFGSSDTRSEKYQDMADLGDMAAELAQLHPAEAAELEAAVSDAVVYNKTTDYDSDTERTGASGLSVYYPYAYSDSGDQTKYDAMNAIGVSASYTRYIADYSTTYYGGSSGGALDSLSSVPVTDGDDGDVYVTLTQEQLDEAVSISFDVWEPVDEDGMEDYYFAYIDDAGVEIDDDGRIRTEFDGSLPMLGDDYLPMYYQSETGSQTIYTCPAILNGEEVDLLISISDKNPDGKIIGAQPVSEDGVPSRKDVEVKKGDSLQIYYYAEYLGDDPDKEDEWYLGEEFTVGSLSIDWVQVPDNEVFLYGYRIEDAYENSYYTDLIEVSFY